MPTTTVCCLILRVAIVALPQASAIVAFEGLNGVGKSTLVRAVAERLGVEVFRTPPESVANARRLFDDSPFSDASLLFYLSWVKRLSDFATLGSAGPLLLCDRYVESTRSFFAAAGNPADRIVDLLEIESPILTVLVVCDEEVRRARLASRTLRVLDRATFSEAFRGAVLASCREVRPLLEIDTSNGDVDTAVDSILSAIEFGRSSANT